MKNQQINKSGTIAARAASATLLLCAAFALAGCGKQAAPAAAPATTVGVVTVVASDQTLSSDLPGRVSAHLSADIRPQVGGIIKARLYQEGTLVKAGQVLYQIDPATYQAAYDSALATVNKARATAAAAKVTAQRNAALAKIDAISQQTADDSQAALLEDQAAVGTDLAALETARINLGYTRITAPIAGRADTSTVTPGALVEASQSTALTTVQQTDPIYVDVTQSSTDLLSLKRALAAGTVQHGADNQPEIHLVLEDGSAYPHTGKLQVAGASVVQTTGTVTLRALVPNPEGLLMPGMYVHGVLDQGVLHNALVVPQQAVTRNASGGASVLLVGADNKVEQRALTLDRAIGNNWQVTSGLKAGERVIVEGSAKVKAGDTVQTALVTLPAAGSTSASTTAAATVAAASAGSSH